MTTSASLPSPFVIAVLDPVQDEREYLYNSGRQSERWFAQSVIVTEDSCQFLTTPQTDFSEIKRLREELKLLYPTLPANHTRGEYLPSLDGFLNHDDLQSKVIVFTHSTRTSIKDQTSADPQYEYVGKDGAFDGIIEAMRAYIPA